ncbi:hypothetical protein [Streptomyces sp. NPDC020965]|uniref:hypothetical protein n=1 Tax=Streptomyces sp. NPDC020965 TaxID=3365105 RepID=UPI0037894B42
MMYKQFGVEPEDSWTPGLRMRGLAGAQPGDDRLGYDYLIHDGDATHFTQPGLTEDQLLHTQMKLRFNLP